MSGSQPFTFNSPIQQNTRPNLPVSGNFALSSMTHSQLEEMINKWTRELDDLEKCFIDEAKKINERDTLLCNNGEKIASLHEKIEQCTGDQNLLEQELQLFEEQQNELESTTESLERELQQIPLPNIRYQSSDRERENIFQLAENCQNELDNILVDVKQMVVRINKENKFTDGDKNELSTNNTDVMGQVSRILNAHIQSLNWIHQKTNDLMNKLNNMQIS